MRRINCYVCKNTGVKTNILNSIHKYYLNSPLFKAVQNSPSCGEVSSFLSSTSCSISFFRSSWLMLHESNASLTNSETPGLVEISSSWICTKNKNSKLNYWSDRAHCIKRWYRIKWRRNSLQIFDTSLDFGLALMAVGGVFGLLASVKERNRGSTIKIVKGKYPFIQNRSDVSQATNVIIYFIRKIIMIPK